MFSIHCNSCAKSWRNKKKDPQRITKSKAFIHKYNWEGINYPSEKDDWKKIEKNVTTAAYTKCKKLRTHFVKNSYISLY